MKIAIITTLLVTGGLLAGITVRVMLSADPAQQSALYVHQDIPLTGYKSY